METAYIPISCSYYDRLEALAVRRTEVEIVYQKHGEDVERTTLGTIDDVYSKGGAEYVRLNTGEIVRLDTLVSVNGIPLLRAC